MSDAKRRIGVFSDIHGNLQALQAVIGTLDDHGVDELFCCGDVVGYGGNPNECCELLRRRKVPTIAGNHDHAALLRTNISFFNDIARAAVLWTRDELTEENRDYLSSLPLAHASDDFFFVHASPAAPAEWNYILTLGEAREAFQYFDQRFCFIGHSHQPFVIEYKDSAMVCPSTPVLELQPDHRYLINVGSVGQPRDRNPLACFVIVDLATNRIEFHRTAYDVEGARQAIMAKGLPIQLAERLSLGA